VTKTVDGFCADCWGVKDPARARRWRPKPSTRPLFDDDLLSAENLIWALGFTVGFVLLALWGLTEWI
jgi:hypothetical protein